MVSGFARARSISPCTPPAGKAGFATSTSGPVASVITGVNDLTVSKGSLLYTAAFIVCEMDMNSSV
jgi:hypothetical protein